MLFNTAAVALLAGAANAAPAIRARNDIFDRRDVGSTISSIAGHIGTLMNSTHSNASTPSSTPSGDFKTVVYFGQSKNAPLEEVCKQNVDVVVTSFVSLYGNNTKDGGAGMMGMSPDWGCAPQNFSDPQYGDYAKETCGWLGGNITSCQKAGKKVLLSVGGWSDNSLMKSGQGKTLADSLWELFGTTGDKNALGGATMDGFDFDIEHDVAGDKLGEFVETVKELRTKGDKLITGAPMCVGKDINVMTNLMQSAQFDELYFQYYNNAPCGANDTKGATEAWDQWYSDLQGGASKSAKLYLGLLGSEAATSESLKDYYIDEGKTIDLVNTLKTHKGFAGAMTWDAGTSMDNKTPSGNYLDSLAKAVGKSKN